MRKKIIHSEFDNALQYS